MADDLITVSRAAIVQAMNLALLDVTVMTPEVALTIADGKATELTVVEPTRNVGALEQGERVIATVLFNGTAIVSTDRRVFRLVGNDLVELRLMKIV